MTDVFAPQPDDRQKLEDLGYTSSEAAAQAGEAEPCPRCHEADDDCRCDKVPPPSNPMAVARRILTSWRYEGLLTLRHWRGGWMRWQRTHWGEIDDREVRSALYRRLEHAVFDHVTIKRGEPVHEVRNWAPSKRKIADLMEAMAAITHLPSSADAPSWIDTQPDQVDGPIVACTNGLLRVADRSLMSLTPRYFNLVSVPFDYAPDAPVPAKWLEFLAQLWPVEDDQDVSAVEDAADSIATLQEHFGYVLSGRTDLHKILMIVGPTRSGKGTIARVLTALVGQGNVAGPTLASLATDFGLSPLLGKPLAVISDARLSGRDGHQVVERLLTISGEDTIDVNRKYKDPWTGRLPTRFMILSNELPHFGDASGVIARRFIVLNTVVSWLGNENTALEGELTAELTGILNWALDGIDRVNKQGRFTEPSSSIEAVITMQDTASPTSAFVREWCVTGPAYQVTVDLLWAAWKSWCEHNGRDRPGTKQMFGRNLQSAAPRVRRVRPRGDDGRQVPMYAGIELKADIENELHSREDRDSTRLSDEEPAVSRVETRPDSLWDSSEDTCHVCGEPMTVVEPGQTTHPGCDPTNPPRDAPVDIAAWNQRARETPPPARKRKWEVVAAPLRRDDPPARDQP